MKKICLSIEQMQKLKELGVDTKDASLVKIHYDDDGIELDSTLFNKEETAWWDEENQCWVTSFYIMLYDAETGSYDHSLREEYATFTLQDMLELMPSQIKEKKTYYLSLHKFEGIIHLEYSYPGCDYTLHTSCGSYLDAAFNMLVWLAENGYLKKEARN